MPACVRRTFSTCLVALCASSSSTFAITGNVDIRAQGTHVFADDINGLQAKVGTGTFVRLTWRANVDVLLKGCCFGFTFFSPDASVSALHWVGSSPDSIDNGPGSFATCFDLGGSQLILRSFDGILPDSMAGAGAALALGFGPTTGRDILTSEFIVPNDPGGIICIDSTFIPPAGSWIANPSGSGSISPTWGAGNGPYSANGFCMTIYPCCAHPGDADGGGDVNITDADFLIRYAFASDFAPPCLDEGDADGDGDITIGDVVFLIAYIFQGGPAPACGPL